MCSEPGTLRALLRVMHCTFCDLIHGAAEVSICHEDSDAIAFMDIQPVNNGHVLVVPRVHYESLLDVPPELGLHLFRVTMRLTGAIRHVTGCEDFNIVVNSGAAAGQDEPHYHVHIIPRREGDGFDIAAVQRIGDARPNGPRRICGAHYLRAARSDARRRLGRVVRRRGRPRGTRCYRSVIQRVVLQEAVTATTAGANGAPS